MTERPERITVTLAGKAWNGHYEVHEGKVLVISAYGSLSAPIGRSKPEKVAARMLEQLAKEWINRPRPPTTR